MIIYTTSNSTEHLPDGSTIEHGEHWVTRCGPAAVPQVAHMIATTVSQHPHIKTWSVVVRVGCPGNWVYGPYDVALDVEHGCYTITDLEAEERTDAGDVDCTSAESLYRVLRQVSYIHHNRARA